MKRTIQRRKMLPITWGVTAMAMSPGWAQQIPVNAAAASPEPQLEIEEVVITARKMEESQQAVPVAVTALSAAALEKAAILNVTDLQTSVPGLLISPNSQGGAPQFSIRAAKQDNGTYNGIAVYIDDVLVVSTLSVANMMYDLNSVSTLKGPQGTLFGGNATGGAVIFRPNKPTSEFGGYAQIGGGNYDRREFQGMMNVPVNDVLQFRIAGEVVRRNGFQDNLTPNAGTPTKMDDDRHESGRLSIRLEPHAGLTNDTVFDFYHKNQQPNQAEAFPASLSALFTGPYTGIPFSSGAGIVPIDPSRRTVSLGGTTPGTCGDQGVCTPTWDKATVFGVGNTTSYDFTDTLSLKNVVGYRHDSLDTYENSTGNTVTLVNGRFAQLNKQWTEEISLHHTTSDQRLRSTTGVFLSDRTSDIGSAYALFWYPGITPANIPFLPASLPIPIATSNWFDRKFRSAAVYAQSSYDLTQALTATAGVRYSWDSGDYSNQPHSTHGGGSGTDPADPTNTLYQHPVSFNYGGLFNQGPCRVLDVETFPGYVPGTCAGHRTLSSDAPSYTFTLEDKLTERSMLYASIRGGYAAGGFNAGVPQSAVVFAPEKVVSYELGFKSDWRLFNRPIRTNFDVFYGKYRNMQRSENSTDPVLGQYVAVYNAGSAFFYGADTEITYDPIDPLQLSVGWTHIHAEYTSFDPPNGLGGVYDESGKSLALTPDDSVTASATLKWPLPTAAGSISSTLSYYWRSATQSHDVPSLSSAGVPIAPQYDLLPIYSSANFTTEWKAIMHTRFDANFWVRNLTNRLNTLYTNNQLGQFGFATATYAPPREIGLDLRYNF